MCIYIYTYLLIFLHVFIDLYIVRTYFHTKGGSFLVNGVDVGITGRADPAPHLSLERSTGRHLRNFGLEEEALQPAVLASGR